MKLQWVSSGQKIQLRTPSCIFKNTRARKIISSSANQDLQGQSVAVIGLGKSGRAAAKLALARGASVLGVDQNANLIPLEKDPFFTKYETLTKTILGEFDEEVIREVDTVVVSPGVPLRKFGLSGLLQSGKKVMSELDFAAKVLPECIKVLAVTGTNGKSTVTTFAGQMLSHLGIEAFVGGNLGNPLSEAALKLLMSPSIEPEFQLVVAEVSSYQMEIPCTFFRPSVAVILNLTPDHLDRHKTMRNYAAAKCRLLSHMTNAKLGLISSGNQHLNEAISEHLNKFNLAWIGDSPGVKIDFDARTAEIEVPAIGCISELDLRSMEAMGDHNYQNAAVAALSVLALDIGIDIQAISSTVKKLKPPPHRMQIVHTDSRGVTWIDDSKATNVEATYTGLMGLKRQKSIVLLGGVAKVMDEHEPSGFEKLIEPLNHHRCVITFGSSGSMIHKTLSDHGLTTPSIKATNLKDAVSHAKRISQHGDAIVLSPGCASFDEFLNFEHRGKVFQELALLS